MKKIILSFGIFGILIGGLLLSQVSKKFFLADIFFHEQSVSSHEVLIPNDLMSGENQTGDVPLFAGEGFPFAARTDTLGISFDISWDSTQLEFLGIDRGDTLFSSADFTGSVVHSGGSSTAHIIISGTTGLSVAPQDLLAKISFRIRENVLLGSQGSLTLTNVNVAYDTALPTNLSLSNVQNGMLTIGSLGDPNISENISEDFFLEKNILVKGGEERLIALRSASARTLTGFVFDLSFPEDKMTFVEVTTQGTPLADKNFEILKDQTKANHIGLLGATGDLGGAILSPDDPIVYLRVLFAEDLSEGTVIPLSIRKMHTTDADLNLTEDTVREGAFQVSSVSTLALKNIEPLSTTELLLEFNDDIVSASLSDITLVPELKNAGSSLEIDGKTLILKNLDPSTSGQIYRLDAERTIFGNIGGSLNPDYSFGFFRGFSSTPINATSDFFIQDVVAKSDTSIEITFSQEVNPASLENTDFVVPGLTMGFVGSSGRKVYLTTTSQSAIVGTQMLTIAHSNLLSDLVSTSGKLLSLNVFPFTPFDATTDGPIIVSAKAESGNRVVVDFDKALLGSSVSSSDFSITEDGSLIDLVNIATTLEISGDHKSVTLTNIPTLAGHNYKISITPGSLLENTNSTPNSTVGNIATFLGQESFFSPWNFVVTSAESIDTNTIRATFSAPIADGEFSPLSLRIIGTDETGSTLALPVVSVVVSGSIATIRTAAQNPLQQYFLIFDPTRWTSAIGEALGVPSGKSVLGFFQEKAQIFSVTPTEINIDTETALSISGKNLTTGVRVFLGKREIPVSSVSDEKIQIAVPAISETGLADIVVLFPDNSESRLAQAVNIIDPDLEAKLQPVVLSEESFASPFRIPNDGVTKSTLWVRVKDPRGVSDIDKVSLDLRPLHGSAGVEMTQESFVDNSAWYVLDITVPPTVSTSITATEIPVTIENKTGRKNYGTVQVLVSRDLEESIPPVVESATAHPAQVAPGDQIPLTFQIEVSDADGASDIARVVVDAGQIGLGIKVLKPLDEITEDAECARSDYAIGEWSACVSGKQTRTVELVSGVECTEVAEKKPIHEQTCAEKSCTSSDWEAKEWTACVNGKQTRDYQKKADVFCVGDNTKPASETRDCSVSFFQDLFLPRANATSIYGNSIWYQSDSFSLPSWVAEGEYDLPVTVIDKEGTEGEGAIHISVRRDGSYSPKIDRNEIYISPRASVPNDNATEFQIFARVSDANGAEDIVSVTANLAPLGMGPVAMTKNQIDGIGAWYSTKKLTIPRQTVKGFRELEISATDKSGNRGKEEVMFYVSFPGEDDDGPTIPVDRAYSNPRAFVNDERTTGSLYVFVEEGDSSIAHVSANLGSIGKYLDSEEILAKSKPNSLTAFWRNLFAEFAFAEEVAQDSDTTDSAPDTTNTDTTDTDTTNTDTTNTDTPGTEDPKTNIEDPKANTTDGLVSECVTGDPFVCLTPSVSEGATGRWYVLPNLTIRKKVEASQDPYFISVVATDIYGKKAEAEVPIFVSDGILPLDNQDMPHLSAVIATAHNKVDVVFSSALDTNRITRDAFDIVFFQDDGIHLPIRDYDVRADGRAVTLETNSMLPGDTLALIVDTEQLGLRNTHANDGKMTFEPYSKNTAAKEFLITSAEAIAPNAVKITLNKDILFQTLSADGINFRISEKTTDVNLPVRGAQIGDNGYTITLSTGTQRSGFPYVLRVNDLLDFSGKELRLGTRIKVFEGYQGSLEERTLLFNQADFNRDGKVDFLDFSIFSTVYGTVGTTLPDDSTSDLNGDGKIDFLDFTIFAQQYGEMQESEKPDTESQDPETPDSETQDSKTQTPS